MMNRCLILLSLWLFFISKGHSQKNISTPLLISNLGTYHFDEISGIGSKEDALSNSCFSAFKETNSLWLSFSIFEGGSLLFDIVPDNLEEDVDFIVFKYSEDSLKAVRCMASGRNLGQKNSDVLCSGNTGLSLLSTDLNENFGCDNKDDNYLKFIAANSGDKYLLFINNYSSGGGLTINFNGECKLNPVENSISKIDGIEIYPNPTQSLINISYESKRNSREILQVIDYSGNIVLEKELFSEDGGNNLILSVSDLLSGHYVIRIKNNERILIGQFVKQNN